MIGSWFRGICASYFVARLDFVAGAADGLAWVLAFYGSFVGLGTGLVLGIAFLGWVLGSESVLGHESFVINGLRRVCGTRFWVLC